MHLTPDRLPRKFEFSDYEKLAPVGTETQLLYARSGISNKTLRKLRHGQYNAEALLDLHGKTIDEARNALAHFLFWCASRKTHSMPL